MAVWEEKERSSLRPNVVERERGTDWGFPFFCKTSGELGLCSQRGCSTERTQCLYVSNRHFPSNQTPSLLSSLSSTSLCIDKCNKVHSSSVQQPFWYLETAVCLLPTRIVSFSPLNQLYPLRPSFSLLLIRVLSPYMISLHALALTANFDP